MPHQPVATTRSLFVVIGEMPSYLRLALERYAQDESFLRDPTRATRIVVRSMTLDCDVVTAPQPASDGVHRTHEDFSPRLGKKHITDLPSWGNPDGRT